MIFCNRRRTGKTPTLHPFSILKYSSFDHRFGMSDELYYGLDACCEVMDTILTPLLTRSMPMPGKRCDPRVILKPKQTKDRYVNIPHQTVNIFQTDVLKLTICTDHLQQ